MLAFIILSLCGLLLIAFLQLLRLSLMKVMQEVPGTMGEFFDQLSKDMSHSLLNLAAFKRQPSFPRIDRQLNYFHSIRPQPNDPCTKCFPMKPQTKSAVYIDLLELPRTGGLPWPRAPGLSPPSAPWFADLRYSLTAPLSKHYPSQTAAVLRSQRVETGIRKTLRERQLDGDAVEAKKLAAQAASYLKEMSATLSMLIARFCGYCLFKCFRRVMRRLLVCPAQLEQIKRAEQEGLPIVYLPLHKSHLDYLLLTWTVWHWDLRLPHIASGDNLNLSGFGWLLRSVGAFFIRRRIDDGDGAQAVKGAGNDGGKDHVYRAVLHSYMSELLRTNQSVEFFAEGTRTRFGKTLLPKNGLLSIVVECCNDGTIPDALLVPVSCTYERVLEGSFWRELMGVPKERESVFGVFKGLIKGLGMSNQCGHARLDFGAPVRLTDYMSALEPCVELAAMNPSGSVLSSMGSGVPHSQSSDLQPSLASRVYSYGELHPLYDKRGTERELVRAIGYHAIYESQALTVVSISSVLSALLLCKYRHGTNLEDLSLDAEWLSTEIVDRGHDVLGFVPEQTDCTNMVLAAIGLLGPDLVSSETRAADSDSGFDDETLVGGDGRHRLTFVQPNLSQSQLLQLAYFKNGLLSVFALDGVIACTLAKSSNNRFALTDLIDKTMFLCELLRFEFIFCKPCENLYQKIESLVTTGSGKESAISGLLRTIPKHELMDSSDDEATPRFYGGHDAMDSSLSQPNTVFLMIARKTSKRFPAKMLRFYANLVVPFVASHLLLLTKLKELVADYGNSNQITERELVQDLLHERGIGGHKIAECTIPGESQNADSYKNALKLLIEQQVLRRLETTNSLLIDPKADLDALISSTMTFL